MEHSPLRHHLSMDFSNLHLVEPSINEVPGTAAIDSEECSFLGADGSLAADNMFTDHFKAVENYVIKTYNALHIII